MLPRAFSRLKYVIFTGLVADFIIFLRAHEICCAGSRYILFDTITNNSVCEDFSKKILECVPEDIHIQSLNANHTFNDPFLIDTLQLEDGSEFTSTSNEK